MARLVAGDVVVVPFPFTDLASSKVRPALVLATSTRDDILLCQITSKAGGHPEAVAVKTTDFVGPEKLRRDTKLQEIGERVCTFVRSGSS